MLDERPVGGRLRVLQSPQPVDELINVTPRQAVIGAGPELGLGGSHRPQQVAELLPCRDLLGCELPQLASGRRASSRSSGVVTWLRDR